MSLTALSPRVEPRLELRQLAPGTVRFGAIADHCLSIHASAPARVSCHRVATRAVVVRGEISLVPIGGFDECVQDDPSSVIDLYLPPSLIRLAAEDLGLDPDRAALEPRFCFRDPRVEHIVWALEAEHRAAARSTTLYRESLGLALAVHLLASYRAPITPRRATGLSARQLARVTEWIEAHLDGDLSLVRLAKVAGVSASHFRVLFKRSTSIPVHEYVIRRRVERARTLLQRGELGTSQIALETGFAHQSHMARCMRRVLGVTPSQIKRAR
ncbi:AraC family transcriptional regulator [Sandaracinus amylolyticus]|uniref:Transcriptional regulator, AraC family protein n=1 Tax=Sandaracinus amylolyticus TaxID=927083 RepID=A0A0F6W863_9BACT|nr:AraC family transcriptional regulator [Sandaracinus amylolyticus]AKF09855.1 Transcriptional regulator, AraC family protein [Sandaracinus amylolyticus]